LAPTSALRAISAVAELLVHTVTVLELFVWAKLLTK